MTRLRALAVLFVVTAGGCMNPAGRGPLYRTRTTPNGVCARADLKDLFREGRLAACARTVKSSGGRRPTLYVEIAAWEAKHLRPEAWRLSARSPDGTVLFEGAIELRERIFPCLSVACPAAVKGEADIPEPWRAGTYPVRLTYLPAARDVDLTITLE